MKLKRVFSFVLLLALVVILGGEAFLSAFSIQASAEGGEEKTYTNVLDDLKKDPTFNEHSYARNDSSHHINVIQLAEGEDGELFLYTYQPGNYSKHYKALYVSISFDNPTGTTVGDYSRYYLKKIKWLNSDGLFDKYLVEDFSVNSSAPNRFYNISAISREFNEEVDSAEFSYAVDGVQAIGIPVGQHWKASGSGDKVLYEMTKLDTVRVNFNASGTVRYSNGFSLKDLFYAGSVDRHYVAFDVEGYDIQKLYDADISYVVKTTKYTSNYSEPPYYENTDISYQRFESEFISSKDTGHSKADGWKWFSRVYTWNRIQTGPEFLSEIRSSDGTWVDRSKPLGVEEMAIQNSDFVFSFKETDYLETFVPPALSSETYCEIENITILRLHFLSYGRTYNLGVVSDSVSTDSTPDFDISAGEEFKDNVKDLFNGDGDPDLKWWEILILILGGIILLYLVVMLWPVLSVFFNLIGQGIKAFIKILISPFKFIGRKFVAEKKQDALNNLVADQLNLDDSEGN